MSTSFDNFTLITDPDFKGTSSGNLDGFGTFNLIVDNNSASTPVSTISFSIHNTGTAWASADDVLAFNSKNFDAAAHAVASPAPGGTPVTGFVGERTGVPDGGTAVMLLGMALGALGMARRYLKS